MKKLFKKLIAFFAIVMLLGSLVISSSPVKAPIAYATNDECGETFEYEKSVDFGDSRVNINFENSDEQIDVSAKSGYKINKVWLDVENDNQSGFYLYANGPVNNFNPNPGGDINEVKVEVEKDCVDTNVCPGGDNSWSSDWYKDQTPSTFNVTAAGYTIDQICVKGGQNKITYTSNGSDGCWSVSGIGTSTASAVKVGSGSTCKDISHASFHRVIVPTDVCTNIGGNQASLPANHYFASAGICVAQTPVCTDSSASNYDNNVTSNEYANNNVCQYPIDVCTNIGGTQTTLPQGYHFDGEGICVEDVEEELCEDRSATNYGQAGVCEYPEDVCPEVDGIQTSTEDCEDNSPVQCPAGQVSQNQNGINICIDCPGGGTCEVIIGGTPTPTPTEAPTPTPTNGPSNNNNNTGGSVQGSSSTPAEEKKGEVLGVTTLPNTGNFAASLATIEQALGVAMLTLGAIIYGQKKTSKKSK